MTGPQLPSPEHATTLDADLLTMRESAIQMVHLVAEAARTAARNLPFDEAGRTDAATADYRAAESRLRSRITALELENERLTTCGCGLQLSTPRCRICDNDE